MLRGRWVRRLVEAQGLRFDRSVTLEMPRGSKRLSDTRRRCEARVLVVEPTQIGDDAYVVLQSLLAHQNDGIGEPGSRATIPVWLWVDDGRARVMVGDQQMGTAPIDGLTTVRLESLAADRVHADGKLTFRRSEQTSGWQVDLELLVCHLPTGD